MSGIKPHSPFKKVGTTISPKSVDDALSMPGASSIGTLVFTGTGLNDASLSGTYTDKDTQTLRIQIDTVGTPDTFKWSIDGGATWVATGITITGAAQALNYIGVSVTFGATTGHTLNDYWQATLNPPTGLINIVGAYKINDSIFGASFGTGNTAIGIGVAGAGKNTGNYNTFMGVDAGYSNTTGSYNTFVGVDAGYSNTTGYRNTFMGVDAGYSNTTGSYNTFVGVNAGRANTTGSYNTFVGVDAGYSNTTGYRNTFVGVNAGFYNTTGYYNTFVGVNAGRANTTGNSNTIIGYYADVVSAALTNAIVIGSNAIASASNTWQIGVIGIKQVIREGVNAAMGTNVLVEGTVTVSNTLVTTSSRIFLTNQLAGGTLGVLSIGTRVAGTSFVINSSNAADTSTIAWEIKEPA